MLESTGIKRSAQSVVTVRIPLVFGTSHLRVHVRGVLSINGEAAESRGLIDNGVVHAVVADHVGGAFNRTTPAGAERREVTGQTVGAVAARELAHAAESNFTEGTANKERGLTAEEAAVVAESTGISAEAVFENETDFHAVTELFNTLQAETGTCFTLLSAGAG